MLQKITEQIVSTPSAFATSVGFRNPTAFDIDVLDHDGHVLLLNDRYSFGKMAEYRALYEALTNDDVEILFVAPTRGEARGQILIIEDALERPPYIDFDDVVSKHTDTELHFENGSRIVCKNYTQSDSFRGYHPDYLFMSMYEYEDGPALEDELLTDIILPMFTGKTKPVVWAEATEMPSNALFDTMVDQGVLVKQVNPHED